MRPGFAAAASLSALAAEAGVDGYERGLRRAGRRRGADRRGAAARLDRDRLGRAKPTTRAARPAPASSDAKLLEVPDGANARGLGEVGCLPGRRARALARRARAERRRIRDALPTATSMPPCCSNADPVRDFPGGPEWSEALGKAKFVARGLDVRGRVDQARRRRLPGRVLRREGGHRHAPRRPPPAPSSRRPPPGRVRPDLAGARRALGAARRRDRNRLGAGGARGDRLRGPVLRRHHPRGDRRPGRPLAGPEPRRRAFPDAELRRDSPVARSNRRRPASDPRGDEAGCAARDLPRPLGRRGRPIAARRCGSWRPSRRSSSRRRTPTVWAGAAATRSTCAPTERACEPGSRSASGCGRAAAS